MRAEWPTLVAGLALLPALQWGFDGIDAEQATLLTQLPPRRLLPALSCGHGETAADLLEVQATNYILSNLAPGQRMDPEQVARFYAGITTLDPNDPDAVVRAAVFLSAMADEADLATQRLNEAIARIPAEHPRRWLLHWELVATHITILAHRDPAERETHIRRAGALMREISTLPGVPSPEHYAELGDRLASRGLSPRDALQSELGFWETKAQSHEEAIRERAQQRLLEVQSRLRRDHLQRALDAFIAQVGRPPRDLHELRQDLADPLGVGYFLLGDRVVAPGCDARQLERNLVPRLRRWTATHPGVPTAADLGVAGLAPYLRVRVDRERAEVQVTDTPEPGGTLGD